MLLLMKCLSLKQPYAILLANGKKTIETRKWNTKFRGDFLIHASKNIEPLSCKYYGLNVETLAKGAIIGKATLYDVKKYQNNLEYKLDYEQHLSSKIIEKFAYGFLIKNALKFDRIILYSGKLGFFNVNLDSNN